MIDEGTYTAHLIGVTFGKSKNTGTPCLASEWHIEEEDANRTVYTYLSKLSKKNSYKKLKAVGFNGDFENPEFEVTTTELNCVHSEYEDYNGDTQENEKWDFASWGSPSVEEADRKTIKKMNAEWKKEVGGGTARAKKAPKKGTGKKAAPAKPKPAEKPSEVPEPEEPEADSGDGEAADDPYTAAWNSFLQNKATEKALDGLENNKRQKALMEWAAILEDAVPDKEESEFDDEDWEAVRIYCETPF